MTAPAMRTPVAATVAAVRTTLATGSAAVRSGGGPGGAAAGGFAVRGFAVRGFAGLPAESRFALRFPGREWGRFPSTPPSSGMGQESSTPKLGTRPGVPGR